MSVVWSHRNSSLCIHPGRKVLRGWKEIRSSWETIFRNTKYLEIETEIIATEVCNNIAYVVLMEKCKSGGRRVQAQSMVTNIFELLAQKWYLVHHHGSPLMRCIGGVALAEVNAQLNT